MPNLSQRNLALELVRVTEAAALAAGRWYGKVCAQPHSRRCTSVTAVASGVLRKITGIRGWCGKSCCTHGHHLSALPLHSPFIFPLWQTSAGVELCRLRRNA